MQMHSPKGSSTTQADGVQRNAVTLPVDSGAPPVRFLLAPWRRYRPIRVGVRRPS